MYFSMRDLGGDVKESLGKIPSAAGKWQFIKRIAENSGYDGMQVSSPIFGQHDISLDRFPEYIRRYRLTFHVNGLFDLSKDGMTEKCDQAIETGFRCAINNHMEDVSFHPPYLPHESHPYRDKVRDDFSSLIERWLPKFENEGITLSVETHVGGNVFLFNGLENFAEYVSGYPGLGILIDVSHNFNDGRSVDEILGIFESLNITGLHLSDAISGMEVKKGTHLPVGKGGIDFSRFLSPFVKAENIYGALEIKSPSIDIAESLIRLKAATGLK